MSDENLNNSEETAALFVSAQKKKKAEEEARKKAAEEQAKRDAAEAEVRRMEQEVEERKRKAEEERIAMENAEKERAQKKADVAEALKEGVNELKDSKVLKEAPKAIKEAPKAVKDAMGDKKKLPILIGAAAAVLVLVIVLVCVFAGGKGGSVDGMEFDAQLTASSTDYNGIPVVYPSSGYSNITETPLENGYDIHFEPSSSKGVGVDVVFSRMIDDGDLNKGLLGTVSPQSMQDGLTQVSKNIIEMVYGDTAPSNEVIADVTAENSVYLYEANFATADGLPGACKSWIRSDANGNYYIISVNTYSKDLEAAEQMGSLFLNNNAEGALILPGSATIESECNDMLTINELHMGIPVPAGRYEEVPGSDINGGVAIWADDNSACIMVTYEELDLSGSDVATARLEIMNVFNESANQAGANMFLEDITERNYVIDNIYDETLKTCAYHMDFDVVRGGVKYWERDYMTVWRDAKTDKLYLVSIYDIAPSKNQAEYQRLFELAEANLKDI